MQMFCKLWLPWGRETVGPQLLYLFRWIGRLQLLLQGIAPRKGLQLELLACRNAVVPRLLLHSTCRDALGPQLLLHRHLFRRIGLLLTLGE